MRGICAFVLLLLLGLMTRDITRAGDISFKAGIGYDYLSQRYFLDSASQEGSDSVFLDWQLRTTYLDDLKGLFSVSYVPLTNNMLEIRSSYEQTADFLRLKAGGDLHYRPGKSTIDFYGDLEWRNRSDTETDFGDSYLFGYVRAKLSTPISRSVSVIFQLKAEDVDFRSVSDHTYDYYRISNYIGLSKAYANFSFADIRLFYSVRQVPDSSTLNYLSLGSDFSFFGSLPVGDIDLSLRLESRDYNRQEDKDDYQRLELYGRNRVELGANWFSRQEIDLEAFLFGSGDLVNNDYYRAGLALLTGVDRGSFSLSAGPDFELLNEKQQDLGVGEDYFETGFRVDFDYLKSSEFFGSLESSIGQRNLTFENDLQSDFYFERLNLITDLRIFSVLNLNILFAAEWEWHREKEDNSELFLLSSSLNYTF